MPPQSPIPRSPSVADNRDPRQLANRQQTCSPHRPRKLVGLTSSPATPPLPVLAFLPKAPATCSPPPARAHSCAPTRMPTPFATFPTGRSQTALAPRALLEIVPPAMLLRRNAPPPSGCHTIVRSSEPIPNRARELAANPTGTRHTPPDRISSASHSPGSPAQNTPASAGCMGPSLRATEQCS